MIRAHIREEWQIPDPKNLTPTEFREVGNLVRDKVHADLESLL